MKVELATVAVCRALSADGNVPELVELLPAGPVVVGRDGRRWTNPAPEMLVRAFAANAVDLPIDMEHSTQIKAPEGEPAPAAGWIKALEVREGGSIWGRVDWTPMGAAAVKNREYRYLSPAFGHDDQGRIVLMISAALTNTPNLFIAALNRSSVTPETENSMDLSEILKSLGLGEKATTADILAAINKLQGDLKVAVNRAETPSLERWVPRADYNAALNRATTAETALKGEQDKQRDSQIETALNAALAAGKITPATVEYHRAQCRQEGGLERFASFAKDAPEVGGDSKLGGRQVPGADTSIATNSVVMHVAAQFGNTAEDIKKYGGDK